MKLHHILYTLLLISLFPITSNGQPARKEKLRVISYNIWNGFEHDASRRANFIDWIKGQQPDILAITELVGFTEKNLGQLASEYGHKYYAIVKEEGYPVGITSNKPITVVKKQVEDFWHGMLHVKTYGLDIIVTHLSPHDWKFRLKEAQMLTKYIQDNQLTTVWSWEISTPIRLSTPIGWKHTPNSSKTSRNGMPNKKHTGICVTDGLIIQFCPNSYPSG